MNGEYNVTGAPRNSGLATLFVLVGLIFMLVQPAFAASYYYWISDLGTLGGTVSRGYGINNANPFQMTGQATTADGQTHAFLNKPMTDLGNLLDGSASYGRAINNLGQVVGNATAADGKQHAFISYPGTFPLADLGTLDGYPCDAAAINGAGQVVGSFTTTKTPARSHPYIWSAGTMVDLLANPLVTANWSYGVATGINDAGQVVGYAYNTTEKKSVAYRFTPGVGMTSLGTLGGKDSGARGINASGAVVGDYRTADGTRRAFSYVGNGPMIDLGSCLADGSGTSIARAINASGDVVGQTEHWNATRGAVENTPFIWSEATGMIDLNTLMINNNSSYQEWYLSDALAINDRGNIVGTGSVKVGTAHETHAFLLTRIAPVDITTAANLPNSVYTQSYSKGLAATGGIPPYTWSLTSGTLPPGLSLGSTGKITGTPTSYGLVTYTFTVEARDTVGLTATKIFTINNTGNVFLSEVGMPTAYVETAYGRQLAVTGGVSPYTFALVGGSLPTDFTLSSKGVVGGTAAVTSIGTYTFTAQVTDSAGVTSPPRSYSLTVAIGPLSVTTTSLSSATRNTDYNKSVAATGGLKPYTWSVVDGLGSLPPGLTLNPATGAITGRVPLTATTGTYSFTVQVTDSQTPRATATKALSILVR